MKNKSCIFQKHILHECKINKEIAFSLYLVAFRLFERSVCGVVSGCEEFSFVSFSFVLSKENEKIMKFYKKIHLHGCKINKEIAFRYTLLRSDCSSRAAGGVVSEREDFSFVSFSFGHKRK